MMFQGKQRVLNISLRVAARSERVRINSNSNPQRIRSRCHPHYHQRFISSAENAARKTQNAIDGNPLSYFCRIRQFMLKPRTMKVPRWVSPKLYTFTVSEMCGHGSFVLVAISYAVDDFLQLRIIAVAGSAVMLCFTYFHPHGRTLWLPFKWNLLFIVINSYRIGRVCLDRYLAEKLSPEILRIRNEHFYIFDPPDFKRLVTIGRIETFKPGEIVARQGEYNNLVRLVVSGTLHVKRDGIVTYKVTEGNFLSETGLHAGLLLSGSVESCCDVVAKTNCRTLTWQRNDLMDLLHREKNLRRAFKAVSSWDIIRKLKGQRHLLGTDIVQDADRWTRARKEQSQNRYGAILENMLHHPQYLQERKRELEKYRLIHQIDDEDHEYSLSLHGWTVEDFDRGHRVGGECIDGERSDADGLANRKNWRLIAHDLYLRFFG